MPGAPERLGCDFRWLWAGFGSSNLADGVLLAAGPLLVTSITLAPFAVLWYGGAGAALTTAWAWRGLADLGRYDPTAPEPAAAWRSEVSRRLC